MLLHPDNPTDADVQTNAPAIPAARQLTRAEAANRLGVDKRTVCRYEQRGTLHGTIGPDGVYRLDSREVEVLAIRMGAKPTEPPSPPNPGKLAAVAFHRFAEGATLRDLVAELEQPPEVLRELHRQWTMDWEAGEKERRRTERERRDERESREVAAINKSYDAMARRQDKEIAEANRLQEETAEKLSSMLKRFGGNGGG